MTIYNVLGSMDIGGNTAIVVSGERDLFRNGIGVLDDQGKPHEVLSVGLDNTIDDLENSVNQTSLLISGKFSSKKIFV